MSFGSRLFGRVVDRSGLPVAGALVVGLPRTIWGTPDSGAAFTLPDRYLTATTDSNGRFVLTGVPPTMEYKLFAFEDLDTNLIYDPDLIGRFTNRDLIDIEGGAIDAPAQQRTQQAQGLRSVSVGLSGDPEMCSVIRLCVIRVVSADETRELNMGGR
jgi:hypothetical protein